MKVSNVKKSGNALSFTLEDIDVAVVNAIRRVVLSEIPNVAFRVDMHGGPGDVVVHKNQSSLHNEMLLHRLSLVPLCFSEDEIESFDPEKYRFVLKAKNTGSEILNVTTKDFVVYDANGKPYPSSVHEKIFPKNSVTGDHVLITKLKPNLSDSTKGDEIDIEARASKDIAKTNVCWCPVSVCTFYNNVDEKLAEQGLRAYTARHPTLDADEAKRRFDALERQRFFKRNQYDEPNSFTFMVESECRIRPENLFEKAIEVLDDKLKALAERVEDVESSNGVSVLDIEGENHTLGNLLQAMMYNKFVRSEGRIESTGYYLTHPLEDRIIMKIKATGEDNAKDILVDTCTYVQDYLKQLLEAWNRRG
jgi:DNA-directed RNA polymerase subunit L